MRNREQQLSAYILDGNGTDEAEPLWDENAVGEGGSPEKEVLQAPEHAFEREALELLDACVGVRIQQTIETAGGTLLSVDSVTRTGSGFFS